MQKLVISIQRTLKLRLKSMSKSCQQLDLLRKLPSSFPKKSKIFSPNIFSMKAKKGDLNKYNTNNIFCKSSEGIVFSFVRKHYSILVTT